MVLTISEHTSSSYSPRTYFNAEGSDLTLAIAADHHTAGELLTQKAAGNNYVGGNFSDKPIDISRKLFVALRSLSASTLNVAGNGMSTLSKHSISQEFANFFVYHVLSVTHNYWPIKLIRCGGQTGVDLSGAVAGVLLDIDTHIMMPKGFRQRLSNGEDILSTRRDVNKLVRDYAEILRDAVDREKMLPKLKAST